MTRGAQDRRRMASTLLHVAAGGAIGAVTRYLVTLGAVALLGLGAPLATLAINVCGSVLMGVLVALLEARTALHLAPFLLVGVLGGFTTFSAFSLDAVSLWDRGATLAAAAYVAASVVLCVGGLALGLALGRSLG